MYVTQGKYIYSKLEKAEFRISESYSIIKMKVLQLY